LIKEDPSTIQLIIETEEQYALMFRAVAKAVKAKVKTGTPSKPKQWNTDAEGPCIEESQAMPGEKPSDFSKERGQMTRRAQLNQSGKQRGNEKADLMRYQGFLTAGVGLSI
jgi:hypothetical protein